nr:MAG TPA: hypothetical protein [Caudoviricetes sp.]
MKRHTRRRPPEGGERRTSLWKQDKKISAVRAATRSGTQTNNH